MPNDQIPPYPGMGLGNLGEPIKLTEVAIEGFAAGPGVPGKMVKVFTRLHLTSDEPAFHRMAKGFTDLLVNRLEAASNRSNVRSVAYTLLVIHPDATADLWLDTAAVSQQILLKRDGVVPGTAIFESDVADVVGMSFPAVPMAPEDRIICLFREGWRYGLFFDFHPGGQLDLGAMQRDLGTLVRRMKYADLYAAIADADQLGRLIGEGWFPFVEIIGPDFTWLLDHVATGTGTADAEDELVKRFDEARLDKLRRRWLAKPHFAAKAKLFDSALQAFARNDAVGVLKTVLTEIEGVLNDAYFAANSERTRQIKKLLSFAVTSAEDRAGAPDTLLFPAAFGRYLRDYVFQDFNPGAATGMAGSRHAVGHGAADADSYTMVRALQALLTLDQLFFYTAS